MIGRLAWEGRRLKRAAAAAAEAQASGPGPGEAERAAGKPVALRGGSEAGGMTPGQPPEGTSARAPEAGPAVEPVIGTAAPEPASVATPGEPDRGCEPAPEDRSPRRSVLAGSDCCASALAAAEATARAKGALDDPDHAAPCRPTGVDGAARPAPQAASIAHPALRSWMAHPASAPAATLARGESHPGAATAAAAAASPGQEQQLRDAVAPFWRLRALPVCGSTETELDRWLAAVVPGPQDPLPAPLALIARRQRFGRGQQGRSWSSPAGGVWLSAALPWPADPAAAAAPGLAVAVGLALELEALSLAVRIKWPNDLLLPGCDGRLVKLAGLLPRLRLQGSRIRWARIGLGLNGINPVPPGATNLRAALGPSQARPERLAARMLRALEWAMAMADQPQMVRRQAEARLVVLPGSWEGAAEGWQPIGLADDGALLLQRGNESQRQQRHFG